MDDITISIIGIMISSILMFLTPLVLIADRADDIAQLSAQTVTSEFVNEVVRAGKITSDEYQTFISSLYASGNTYDIDMEVKILDETPSKRVTDDTGTVGNNSYYSIFTSQIEDKIGLYKGAVTENYVANQLLINDFPLYYWESSGEAEVDFLITTNDGVIPIEVKAADNTKSKSLKIYTEKYKPKYSIKISTKNFGFNKRNNIKSVPLYAVFCIKENTD